MNMGYHTHLGSTVNDQNQMWANKVTGNRDFRVSWDRNISTFELLPKLGGCMTVGEKEFLRYDDCHHDESSALSNMFLAGIPTHTTISTAAAEVPPKCLCFLFV